MIESGVECRVGLGGWDQDFRVEGAAAATKEPRFKCGRHEFEPTGPHPQVGHN